MEHNIESGYKVINIILLECNFKREAFITTDPKDIANEVNVGVNVQVNGPNVTVIETLDYVQKAGENIEVTAKIIMAGIFEKFGDQELDIEQFGHINGAAIIFPFIREQLSSFSIKAGLNPILLPPMNFTMKPNQP